MYKNKWRSNFVFVIELSQGFILVWFMVFNTTFNNFTAISWWSVSLVEEIRVITKLPNSEQSFKGKVKTLMYINRQNQSTTGKLEKP
jgi:hypothetical protein